MQLRTDPRRASMSEASMKMLALLAGALMLAALMGVLGFGFMKVLRQSGFAPGGSSAKVTPTVTPAAPPPTLLIIEGPAPNDADAGPTPERLKEWRNANEEALSDLRIRLVPRERGLSLLNLARHTAADLHGDLRMARGFRKEHEIDLLLLPTIPPATEARGGSGEEPLVRWVLLRGDDEIVFDLAANDAHGLAKRIAKEANLPGR